MNLRYTHTFVTLNISKKAFNEIKRKLKAADYHHVFLDKGKTIDMQGIGLVSSYKK